MSAIFAQHYSKLALLRLLRDLGLRRGEAVRLDVSDLDLAGDRIMVLGKARSQKEPVTLPEPTKAALEAWLQARGTEDGPLFVNFDRPGKGGRLTGSAVYFIVSELGTKAGLTVRPHGLRHLAITSALDLTKGDATSRLKTAFQPRFPRLWWACNHCSPQQLLIGCSANG